MSSEPPDIVEGSEQQQPSAESSNNQRSAFSAQLSGGGTPGRESTMCLVTPPANISIGHLYIYNFSPQRENTNTVSVEIPIPAKDISKFQSPAASSGPFCRICHEGDSTEDLVSPCHCTGTVGLVHISCMERWLSLAGSDRCEICNYKFITVRSPKSFAEWIRSSTADSESRRSFVSDILCFCLLTPLAGVSSFLCVEGAKKQVLEGNSLEAGCLMALATFLITIYFIWNLLTCRFHLKNYLKWRAQNQNVKVVRVRRLSRNESSRTTQAARSLHQDLENTAEVAVQIPESSESSQSFSAVQHETI